MKTLRQGLMLACVLTAGLVVGAEPTFKGDPKVVIGDSAVRQEQVKRAFEAFAQKLAIIATRLSASADGKDRDRAKSLRKAVTLIREAEVHRKFDALVRALSAKDADRDLDLLARAVRDNKELRDDLRKLIALLTEDGRDATLKQRELELKELLAKLQAMKTKQERLRAKTERNRDDQDALAKAQDDLAKDTKDLLRPSENKPARELVRKPLTSAANKQGKASGQVRMGKPADASESQGGAVRDIDDAITIVQNEINENNREQRERKLRDLLARCKTMLAHQKQVQAGIVGLDEAVRKTADGRPTVAHAAGANRLADVQLESLREAEGAMKLIREDGTAVAFAEALESVMTDMESLKRRLDETDVADVTQRIAADVVESLLDMIRALEKAIQENEPGTPPPGGPGGLPGQQPLVNRLQQLKMILAMQRRVNGRTELYGQRYRGEQAATAGLTDKDRRGVEAVLKELADLAKRQGRIGQATRELSKQADARPID